MCRGDPRILTLHQSPTILDKINWKPRPPPPSKSRMGKWRVFALRVASSLIWGGWGFAVPFYFVQDCNLGQNKWKTWSPPPPPPNQGWENGANLPFAWLHPWFRGDGGLLFHFILSKIVVKLIFATLLDFKLPKSICILQYCYFPKVTKVKVFFAIKLSQCG